VVIIGGFASSYVLLFRKTSLPVVMVLLLVNHVYMVNNQRLGSVWACGRRWLMNMWMCERRAMKKSNRAESF